MRKLEIWSFPTINEQNCSHLALKSGKSHFTSPRRNLSVYFSPFVSCQELKSFQVLLTAFDCKKQRREQQQENALLSLHLDSLPFSKKSFNFACGFDWRLRKGSQNNKIFLPLPSRVLWLFAVLCLFNYTLVFIAWVWCKWMNSQPDVEFECLGSGSSSTSLQINNRNAKNYEFQAAQEQNTKICRHNKNKSRFICI